MSNDTPLPPEPFLLNAAQQSGIAGVEEQLERAFALVSSAGDFLRDRGEDVVKDDLQRAILLLNMAEEELGTVECLNRIREGRFR